MVRILVTPERLIQLSNQMNHGAAQLHEVEGQLGRTLSGLDWEVRQQANVDGQVSAARSQARQLANEAESLARYLADRAEAFRQADSQEAEKIGSVGAEIRSVLSSSGWSVIRETGRKIRKIVDLGELLAPVGAAGLIAASLHAGSAYAGEVIIDLPNWLSRFKSLREIREMILLPGHFNHVAYANLPSKMLQWGVVLSIPTIIGKWQTDAMQYQGTKLVSALAVDAALTLLPVVTSFAVSQAITWGATALGTAVFPGLGSAAGYAVGTAIASMVTGTAANVATQWAIDHYQVRDKLIDRVDQGLQGVVQDIQQSYQQPLPSY